MYVVLQNYDIHFKGNAISIILFVSVKERFSNGICVRFSNVICVKNDLQHIRLFLIL